MVTQKGAIILTTTQMEPLGFRLRPGFVFKIEGVVLGEIGFKHLEAKCLEAIVPRK